MKMTLKSLATRVAALSSAALVVFGYLAVLAIVFLQDQWAPIYAPPNAFWSVVLYALTGLAIALPLLGFVLSVLNLVRWRRLAESCVALLLLLPMFLVAHTVVVRSRAVNLAQQSVAADRREDAAPAEQ
jgi:hypothetical protein